ncbi:MFS transporter [Clostridium estertheticum]|nr:MFS transporter [Clostridium estertheticum]
MSIADVVRLITLSIIFIFSISNSINISIIYTYAVISGTMTSIFQPAYSATRAEVFTKEIRNAANSLTQISEQFVKLVGPSLGALIISFTSISIGFGIDAATLLISVVSLIFLKIEKTVPNPVDNKHRLL